MVQPGQGARLAAEPLREIRIAPRGGGKHLERDPAVQSRLPGLVDRAHAALPEQFDDFQVREERRDLGHRRRGLTAIRRGGDCFGGKALLEQTGGAKSAHAGRQRSAALGTGASGNSGGRRRSSRNWHRLVHAIAKQQPDKQADRPEEQGRQQNDNPAGLIATVGVTIDPYERRDPQPQPRECEQQGRQKQDTTPQI